MSHPHDDLTRSTLTVLFIGGLIMGSFWVVRPFLPATVWAVTLVIATWPLMLRVQHLAGNRRGVAVLVMTLALLLLLIIPIWLSISTILANMDEISHLIRSGLAFQMPPPPVWLSGVPMIGARATEVWGQINAAGAENMAPKLIPYAESLGQWLLSAAGGVGGTFIHFLFTVGIAAVLYARGERAGIAMIRFGRRLGGDRGETAVRLAGQAIRGVALGVVVTALAQSVLGGIGLAVVGVPFVPVLTALMFMLCLAQIGPSPVLIPAVAWMYYSGEVLWATVLLAFTTVDLVMDNFLRPMLIRKGADLPTLLVLAGVIGGLIAFGLLGIFIGPTVLAITYTLLNSWMEEDENAKPSTTAI